MNDPSGVLGALLAAFQKKIGNDLHVSFPCRVIAYDETKRLASVQPLVRITDDEPALIERVPVMGQRLKILSGGSPQDYVPVYLPGDTVLVSVCDNEIKNVLSGSVATPDSTRQHDRNDCVIIGVIF
ncbi:Gp138 family membrane-puncturing spike protein [Paenibacillus campi]|uniref:Gp138 family membrane-puncturing spike protein n=1 Tax=Paenibacillus campi TaxID=3106031 RepID=UPI002AFF6A5E|nr:Gp138 family membrane-puncturing spike protein [Paenibacillus sp. SGZ-1014]